jgi:serine phosphatase RsbU (regulator of sigma subunit)
MLRSGLLLASIRGIAIKRTLFIVVAAVVMVTTVFSLFYTNANTYSFGFSLRLNRADNILSIQTLEAGGLAESAGFHIGDVIFSINDYRINLLEVNCKEKIAAQLRTGKLEIVVERSYEMLSAELVAESSDISSESGIFSLIGLLYIGMGLWVFAARQNYSAATSWGFFAVLFGGMVSQIGASSQPIVDIIFILIYIVVGAEFFYSAAAGLHFSLVFPKPRKFARRQWVVPIIYMVASGLFFIFAMMLLALYLFDGYGYDLSIISLVLSIVIISTTFIYFGLMLSALISGYLLTTVRSEKRRMRAVIFGTVIPLGVFLLVLIIESVFYIRVPASKTIIAWSLAALPISYLYAIVRHRVMQVRLILKSGLIYGILTAIVFGLAVAVFMGVFGILLLLRDLLPKLGGRGSLVNNLLLNQDIQTFIIAALSVLIGSRIGKVKSYVQNFVDRKFYRERFNYKKTLTQLTAVLEQMGDQSKMLEVVLDNAADLVHPHSMAIVLPKADHGAVAKSRPEAFSGLQVKTDSYQALERVFAGERIFIGQRELDELSTEDSELIESVLVRLAADICIPMVAQSGLQGYLVLGKKLSEKGYNLEEIKLLKILADQGARGIEHVRLAKEAADRERLRQEIEIGRDMQLSLLPASMPTIPGLDLVAMNEPAMEVGGDFYGFIEHSPTRLGIMVGDIVGKGVAGALNMASTITSLRLIAEESTSTAEAMQRLNRFMVRNSTRRTFAAAVYATIDVVDGSFHWSNGGFPDPILIPRQGKARYLEMEQYPFPPGVQANSIYTEQVAKLESGDTILFLSDSAMETIAKDDSAQYGYEQILEFVDSHREENLWSLLREIHQEVVEYGGTINLDDDFTAVACRLK